jgi:hypothetical protein
MEKAIIILFSISILLLLFSFIKRDKVKYLEEQVEQLSLSLLQETYQIKKKIKVLEEELLISESEYINQKNPVDHSDEIDREKISELFQNGINSKPVNSASKNETEEDRLIAQMKNRGRQS